MTIFVLILIAFALFAIVGHARDRNVLEAARLELEASRHVQFSDQAQNVDSGEQREALLRVVASAREVVEAMPRVGGELTPSRLEELVAAQPDICRQLTLEQRQVLARADFIHNRLERFIAADRARPGWDGPSGDPTHPGWLAWRMGEALRRYPQLGREKVEAVLNFFQTSARFVSRCPPEAIDVSERYINLMLANQQPEIALLLNRDERTILVRAEYANDKVSDA